MRFDIEEYKIREDYIIKCIRCKESKQFTELFDISETNKDSKFVCGDCIGLRDRINNTNRLCYYCKTCKCYIDNWEFVVKNKDGSYDETEECLTCRLYKSNLNKMLQKEMITCQKCNIDHTYIEIYRVDDKYMCRKCIEKNIDQTVPDIQAPIGCYSYGRNCQKCNINYPKWYFVDYGTCNKCAYKERIHKVIENRKKESKCKVDDIDSGSDDLKRSRSLHKKCNENVNSFTTFNESPPNSLLTAGDPHFYKNKHEVSENKEVKIKTNKHEVSEKNKPYIYYYFEYKLKSVNVKCEKCSEYFEKICAFGSVREEKNIDYERDGFYHCLDCAIIKNEVKKIKDKEKKKNENKEKKKGSEKVINFNRVFDDEIRGVKTCGKCKRVYPNWHYISNSNKDCSFTKECLECRNLETLTKTIKKKKIYSLFEFLK